MQESGEPSHTISWVMEQGIFLLLIDEGFFLFLFLFFFFKLGLTELPWSGSHGWGESISVINWLGMIVAHSSDRAREHWLEGCWDLGQGCSPRGGGRGPLTVLMAVLVGQAQCGF